MPTRTSMDAGFRKAFFSELTDKRLNSVAYDLGHFDAAEVPRAQLLEKLSHSRRFSTDIALSFLSLRELKEIGKVWGLPRGSSDSFKMKGLLIEHFKELQGSKTLAGTSKRKTKIKPKTKNIKPKIKPISPKQSNDDSPASSSKDSSYVGLDPEEWVQCPMCPSPVKRCNIEAHLARVHGLTSSDSDKIEPINYGMIIEAIGREWCIWFMRHSLKISERRNIPDEEVIRDYFSDTKRNLLSLLARLDAKECEVVADYLDLELENSEISTYGRLVQALYRRADVHTRTLLQHPASKDAVKKQLLLDKKRAKQRSKATSKPKPEPEPEPESKETLGPIKVFTLISVKGRDPQADFVFCPICENEVTFYHLPRHLSRLHPETRTYNIFVKRKGSASSEIRLGQKPSPTKTIRQKPKPKQKTGKKRVRKKGTSNVVNGDQRSEDLFDRGKVVSGGAYGLGKNRRH